MHRAPACLALVVALTGCRAYVESTPRQVSEDDHPANYSRIFREPVPGDVTVVNSMVVTYSFRPGVVTTDDFEFELIAPQTWIRDAVERFYLRMDNDEFTLKRVDARRARARPWYGPGALDRYDLYRDLTSVGYVHMLVRKDAEPDGRRRIFISKH